MKFENTFEVPLPPEAAWDVLMDVERIAPCMPGATLTEIVDERTFKGTVAVRLGPVALTFAGDAAFETIDAEARTARVKATGRDPKGRGGASATVDFRLAPSDTGRDCGGVVVSAPNGTRVTFYDDGDLRIFRPEHSQEEYRRWTRRGDAQDRGDSVNIRFHPISGDATG